MQQQQQQDQTGDAPPFISKDSTMTDQSDLSTSPFAAGNAPAAGTGGVKYGRTEHLVFHEESGEKERMKTWRDLIKPPLIRQWVQNGKLHREPCSREVYRFELFFDLLFVGIIHQLADAAAEDASPAAVARFVLTFYPSWSVWTEARNFSNLSGQDDIIHRLWILLGMGCLLGYSVNASAIQLSVPHSTEAAAVESTLHERAGAAVAEAAGSAEHGSYHYEAVRAAVGFYLVIKLTRLVGLVIYGLKLREFRFAQFINAFGVFATAIFYLPLIWVRSLKVQIILASLGTFFDVSRPYFIGFVAYLSRNRHHSEDVDAEVRQTQASRLFALRKDYRLPAINIEHHVERLSAFVVIVLGEHVLNITFHAGAGDFGLSEKFGKAMLALMTAFALNWLYFAADEGNSNYEHALRRHWFSGVNFTTLHWPLCAALILASAASAQMVAQDTVPVPIAWYWGSGIGFSVFCLGLLDWTHRDLEPFSYPLVPRVIRLVVTLSGAIALILLPLAENLSSLSLLGVTVGVTWALVIIDIFGRLVRGSHLKDEEVGHRE